MTSAVSTLFAVLMTVALVPLAASAANRSGSAIPTGFRAQSLSWASPKLGWMLGVGPCGQSTCTTVIGTTDGGGTWNTVGTLNAPLTLEEEAGVTQVRFADALHGWAFWPALWATSDGGMTWNKQTPPGGGHVLRALAGNSDAVYAVVSPCRMNHPCNDPSTLWRTTAGGGTWTQVPVTLPVSSEAVLAVHGVAAYLVVPANPDVFDVTVDGQNWLSRPDPCDPGNGENLTGVVPVSDTKVALLCQGDIGFGKAAKLVLRSSDNGQTTRPAGVLPLYGIVSQLASTPNGTLVVSSFSIGSWIYRNAGGKTWTTSEDLGDGGIGWNDVAFTTNSIGFVIHGPASCCGGHGPGELWQTQDGGVTWAPV
jgi:photosystem II stability/assembly factor-like uncharacterized protein